MVRSYAQIQADSGLGDCASTKGTPAHLERIGVASAQTFSSTHGMFPHRLSFGMLSEGLFPYLRGAVYQKYFDRRGAMGMIRTAFLLPHARRRLVTGAIEWMKGCEYACLYF
jgi:hypothetical protein